jgi:hypothetical protein
MFFTLKESQDGDSSLLSEILYHKNFCKNIDFPDYALIAVPCKFITEYAVIDSLISYDNSKILITFNGNS